MKKKKKKRWRTYRLIKLSFVIEPYQEENNDKAIRKCSSSYRVSADRLRIERGRHVREKKENRLSLSCNTIGNGNNTIFI